MTVSLVLKDFKTNHFTDKITLSNVCPDHKWNHFHVHMDLQAHIFCFLTRLIVISNFWRTLPIKIISFVVLKHERKIWMQRWQYLVSKRYNFLGGREKVGEPYLRQLKLWLKYRTYIFKVMALQARSFFCFLDKTDAANVEKVFFPVISCGA